MTSSPDSRLSTLIARGRRLLEEQSGRFRQGILIACSGGPDSTALVRLCHELRDRPEWKARLPELFIGHVHHGIRGADADADAAFVESLARQTAMRFLLGEVDVPALAKEPGGSIESRARELRYRMLEDWADAHSIGLVLTAHNADDQRETVLLALCRGAGPRGLRGMPGSRPLRRSKGESSAFLLRPLLDWDRADIRRYLNGLGQPFRVDRTNEDTRIPRNAVRHIILPTLAEKVHPGVRQSLTRLTRVMGSIDQDHEDRTRELWKAAREPLQDTTNSLALSSSRFGEFSPSIQDRILREAVARLAGTRQDEPPLYFGGLEELRQRLCASSRIPAAVQLGRGWSATVDDDILRVHRPGAAEASGEPPVPAIFELPGETRWDGWTIRGELLDACPALPREDPLCEVIDAGRLGATETSSIRLSVRRRQNGDRFHPLGAPGRKKLKEYFRERRLSIEERDLVPLVTAGEHIVWVVGQRSDERFRVTGETRRWARLSASPPT